MFICMVVSPEFGNGNGFHDLSSSAPFIVKVDPWIRVKDGTIYTLGVFVQGRREPFWCHVIEYDDLVIRLSIAGSDGGCAYTRETRKKSELWLDVSRKMSLPTAHPLLAGLLGSLDWSSLPRIAGLAGEEQAYLQIKPPMNLLGQFLRYAPSAATSKLLTKTTF